MQVKMGHALADTVVDSNESAGGAERLFDGAAEELGARQKRPGELLGEVRQCLEMDFGHEEGMSLEEWTVIQEREKIIVFVNHCRFDGGCRDAAKQAIGRHSR